MTSALKQILIVFGLAFLAACTTPQTQEENDQSQIQTSQEALEALAEEAPEPDGATSQQETITEAEPVSENPPVLTKDDLMGMEPAQIQNLLGDVSLKRWEGEVQVMQFKNGACVLDVYFYESAPGEAYEVSYLSARYLGGADMDTDACLATLVPVS